jgi:dsRNA-specific ribonuclease
MSYQTYEPTQLYSAPRDYSFKKMITSLLERGQLKAKYINILTNDENMELYSNAFTAASADPIKNYEIFEQLGDLSANKFIVWYAYHRFPQLECPLGVKVVARIRINYGARQSFSQIADSLGFWPFISASMEDRSRKKKDLLEDCLEAFIGCTEKILDKAYRPGVGYGIVFDILSDIFDKIPISLHYNDLYDAKTRLKELFDMHKSLGTWVFIDKRNELLAESNIYQVPTGSSKQPIIQKTGPSKKDFISLPQSNWVHLGKGMAAKKADAQQKAADYGLRSLNRNGWVREIPEEYTRFLE